MAKSVQPLLQLIATRHFHASSRTSLTETTTSWHSRQPRSGSISDVSGSEPSDLVIPDTGEVVTLRSLRRGEGEHWAQP
ncbi:MAG: hypothetical protein ACYCST_07965 [Acidimicrobiales bacterium]